MPRFHLPAPAWQDEPVLTGDEARHLSQVLRMKAGERVLVFDGEGRRAPAEILDVARERVALRLGEAVVSPPPRPTITLAQAIPKGKNMDFIVQKAVELGVSSIQPLVTRHTVVQPGENKAEKWRRVALEACKQCGQDRLPVIADALPFDRWIADAPAGLKLVASLAPGARPFREVLAAHPDCVAATIIIGPEGDFSEGETAAALAAGFLPITLGGIVLRVETAALYGLSALRFAFG